MRRRREQSALQRAVSRRGQTQLCVLCVGLPGCNAASHAYRTPVADHEVGNTKIHLPGHVLHDAAQVIVVVRAVRLAAHQKAAEVLVEVQVTRLLVVAARATRHVLVVGAGTYAPKSASS